MTREAVGKKKLRDIIMLRERGYTVEQTAHRLGIMPWQVSYVSRFVKTCISNEEYGYLLENAYELNMTPGELMMDVFNEHFDAYARKKKLKIKVA